MKTVRIKVTENNIKWGGKQCAYGCPISLAFKDAGVGNVGVTGAYYVLKMSVPAGWGSVKVNRYFKMPPLIGDWVRTFDRGGSVLPIEFTANIDPNNSYNEEYN